jgi:hypothetical protein
MKRLTRSAAMAFGLLLAFAAFAPADTWDLNWNTIDGGGATFSTGGGFELGGTIGQPDAGPVPVMSGGSYTLEGGFWYPTIGCNSPPQDADGDGDVDLTDFLAFQTCFNGPNRSYAAGGDPAKCACLDAEPDGDVDLTDFLQFQVCFNGPNRPPACQ